MNEHIAQDIAREESMPTASQIKQVKNAVFVDYDPKVAIDKLLNLSTNPSAAEKLQYVKHLSELVQAIGDECIVRLGEILKPLLKETDKNIKRTMLQQLHPIVVFLQQRGEKGYDEIIKYIVPIVSALLNDKNYDIKEEAGEEMTNIANFLNEKDRGEYFLTPVLAMAHDDDNEENRMIGVQLLSKMAHVFGRDLCDQFIGLEFLSKGEDPQLRVRKEAVMHLNMIGKAVSKDFFNKRLLPFYLRICKDQAPGVRKACVLNACEISKIADGETRENKLSEIYLRFLEDSNKLVKVEAYKLLGPYIATLHGNKIHEKLIENYLKMTNSSINGLSSDNEIIQECAFNFPAVLLTLGGTKWPIFSKLFKDLIKGPEKVKKPLACSLHEIAKIIGEDQAERDLFKVMEAFLKDPSDNIKYGVIQHLAEFIAVFQPKKRENMIEIFLQLQKDQKKWRIRELIANQIDTLASVFSKETVFQIITPISFKLCTDTVSIVREEASKKIASLLDKMEDAEEEYKQFIIANINSYSQANRFIIRQAFIFMCSTLMDNPERFKQHFLENFVAMGTDKVPNVRILVAKVVYEKYAAGNPLFENSAIRGLIATMKKDKSRDVLYWMSKINIQGEETKTSKSEESEIIPTKVVAKDIGDTTATKAINGNHLQEEETKKEDVAPTQETIKEEVEQKTNTNENQEAAKESAIEGENNQEVKEEVQQETNTTQSTTEEQEKPAEDKTNETQEQQPENQEESKVESHETKADDQTQENETKPEENQQEPQAEADQKNEENSQPQDSESSSNEVDTKTDEKIEPEAQDEIKKEELPEGSENKAEESAEGSA